MKKNFVIALCCIINSVLFSQPRTNPQPRNIIEKTSPIVSDFVGWSFSESSNRWSGYYNMLSINRPLNNQNNSTKPYRETSREMSFRENIVNMQTTIISHDSTKYYILSFSYWSGYYEYPSIYEGWNYSKAISYYVINQEDYCSIFEMANGEEKKYDVYPILGNDLKNISLDDVWKYSFSIKKFAVRKEDDNTIRIRFPQKDDERFNMEIGIDPIDFSKRYFEVPYKSFIKLFIE